MTTTIEPTDKPAAFDGAFRGRRLSWKEFYKQRPDLRPDNDDREEPAKREAA